jgi:anaerobic ribonucleoside-triphosphate reductase activating protein
MFFNINCYIPVSEVNGPGKRFVIWFQGCVHGCENCFNKDLQEQRTEKLYSLDELVKLILDTKDIEGVTFTGGEPFLQYKELLELSQVLKSHSLSIVSYTGFTLEELKKRNDENINNLLGLIDILIDSKYIDNLKTSEKWIGSSNQNIHFLSERYKSLEGRVDFNTNEIEYIIDKNGLIMLTGLPDFND